MSPFLGHCSHLISLDEGPAGGDRAYLKVEKEWSWRDEGSAIEGLG